MFKPKNDGREKPSFTSQRRSSRQDDDQRLPSILDSRGSGTGNFNKRFQKAAKTHNREKFVVSSQIMSEDEGISTPAGSALIYNEFELLPKMRETYHAPRPDFGEIYVQNKMQNYMSDNNQHMNNSGTNSGDPINYPEMVVNESVPAQTVQNSIVLPEKVKPPKLLKKKKVKKGRVQKSLFNRSPIRPLRLGSLTKRNGSVQERQPISGIRVAPTYNSSNLHSTSNRMASIYKQPIVGGLRKKAPVKNFGSHNFISNVSTND